MPRHRNNHHLVLWYTTEQRDVLDYVKGRMGMRTRAALIRALVEAAAGMTKEQLYGLAARDMVTYGHRKDDGVEQVRVHIDDDVMAMLKKIRKRFRNAGAVILGLAQFYANQKRDTKEETERKEAPHGASVQGSQRGEDGGPG